MAKKKPATEIEFVEDTGVTRASKTHFNKEKVEALLQKAREWIDENHKVCKISLVQIEQILGVGISCANNFSWMCNPRNKHAPFSDLALKYKIKVGAHHGVKRYPKEEQESYFRGMADSEKG